jgi:8-oxo-dGTP pyrophosphatase MutT (NUDIX family)
VTRSTIFSSPWCTLVAESRSDGNPYYLLDVPDYVAVIARTRDRRILLVRQHRLVTGREAIELPSGHVDAGETPEEAARRELFEETGARASSMELLGELVPDIGRLTNRMWCFFAADVDIETDVVDTEEGITRVVVSESEALAMAGDGRMEHALNLAALFLAVSKGKLSLEPTESGS